MKCAIVGHLEVERRKAIREAKKNKVDLPPPSDKEEVNDLHNHPMLSKSNTVNKQSLMILIRPELVAQGAKVDVNFLQQTLKTKHSLDVAYMQVYRAKEAPSSSCSPRSCEMNSSKTILSVSFS